MEASMNRIKSLREEKGMTQLELGKLLGVKDAAISKYESEKVPLTAETILKLSEIFSVSTDYILGRTMEKSGQDRKVYGRCDIMERKLFVIGTSSITQAEYDELAGCPDTERLSDENAKTLLHHFCGFVKERIHIIRSEPVYEYKHWELYKTGERDRSPLYHSAGRNYILFDCCCTSYEYKDGSLRICTIDTTEIQEEKGEEDGKEDTHEGMRDVR